MKLEELEKVDAVRVYEIDPAKVGRYIVVADARAIPEPEKFLSNLECPEGLSKAPIIFVYPVLGLEYPRCGLKESFALYLQKESA